MRCPPVSGAMVRSGFAVAARLGRNRTIAALVTVAAATLAAPAAASACADVTYIGAAGSGELAASQNPGAYSNMGPEVNDMASVMKARLLARGLTLTRVPVIYPAASTSLLSPNAEEAALLALGPIGLGGALTLYAGNVDSYMASIQTGIANTISTAKHQLSECPGTELVLAGYSQGAIAVHHAELEMVSDGDGNLINHIAGTLLLGDGDRYPNSAAKLFGAAPKADEGVRTYFRMIQPQDVPWPSTTAEICNDRDIVCDFNLGTFADLLNDLQPIHVHEGYKTSSGSTYTYSPLLAQAADWLANKISPSAGQIVFSPGPGTAAPTSTLGPFTMTAFGTDPGPLGSTTTSLSGPTGVIQFNPALLREQVANGWATWSNGFTGDVYWTNLGGDTATMTLPPGTRAFYFYAEPDEFADYAVDATADSGASTGDVTVYGDAGAQYFGFYVNGTGAIDSVTISSPDDFAIGEFGIAGS